MLLVDETNLQDNLKVMAVSLAYRGRAIPLPGGLTIKSSGLWAK